MTVLERKKRFISALLIDTDEERFVEMEKFYKNLQSQSLSDPDPCMYTVGEIRMKIPAIIEELEEGKGIPHEAIKRKIVL